MSESELNKLIAWLEDQWLQCAAAKNDSVNLEYQFYKGEEYAYKEVLDALQSKGKDTYNKS